MPTARLSASEATPWKATTCAYGPMDSGHAVYVTCYIAEAAVGQSKPERLKLMENKQDKPLPAEPVQEMRKGEQIAESANCSGWIVTDGGAETYRTWQYGMSGWTKDRSKATRYARREDAEAVHAEDEDAWRVEPFGPSEDGWREERERLRAALREMVAAMRRYEMDVDDDPPGAHREMMRKAEALSEPQEQGDQA